VRPRLLLGVALAVCGCGDTAAPGGTEAAPRAAASTSAAPADRPDAAADAGADRRPADGPRADLGLVPLRPASLERKTTPRERRLADEQACEANDAARCRRAADRYRGYGHIAGCGVDREGPRPRRMVTAADAASDAKLFDRWIRRACDLGDEDACVQGRNNVASHRIAERDADACARSGLADCPLYQWVAATRPEKAKAVEAARRQFMDQVFGGKLFGELYARQKAKNGYALPADLAGVVERLCATTLECDDVFMMLDKDGYTPDALAPVRKAAGERLVARCLDGDCVCGEAARYLDPADPRLLDLARIGCDDGEPDACFVLGDLYDRGAGVERSPATAFALYEVACPSALASDRREERYSKAACARLAERYEEGTSLEKDVFRAYFYTTLACTRGGFERDHAPCVRRGRLQIQNNFGKFELTLQTNAETAREFFYGIEGDPVNGKECERPSVEALCKRDASALR
jgi:TPR repeat protein